jgi:hypothetical protein
MGAKLQATARKLPSGQTATTYFRRSGDFVRR